MSKTLEWVKITFEYDEELNGEVVTSMERVSIQSDADDSGTDALYVDIDEEKQIALMAKLATVIEGNTVCLAFDEGDLDELKEKAKEANKKIMYTPC